DNQPDYNFVAPFEAKYGVMYLYGIKELSGIKEANKDFAINLDLTDGKALIQVNATSVQEDVRVVLTHKGEEVLNSTVDVSPLIPYQQSVDVGGNASLEDMRLTLFSKDGGELISWQKQPARNEPFPDTYHDPLEPSEYATAQELFFAGLKIEQFGNTNFDYMKYYEAALKLDPNDVMTNTQIGTVYLKRGEYAQAEEHLKRAVDVVTGNHKKAQNATSLYYLGVCYLKQGRIDDALEMLYRSTWAYELTSAGYTLIAQIEGSRNDWDRALDAAERACKANTQNIEALVAQAIILRHRGAYPDALNVARQALVVDPLCFAAMNELRFLSANISTGKSTAECRTALVSHLRAEPYNYIETAARYSAFGLFDDAADVMRIAAASDHEALNSYPMVYYHLGMYLALAGQQAESEQALQKASSLSTNLCFPYGDESVRALRFAIARNDKDTSAWYLLGNALANNQHEEAVKCWEMAANKGLEDSIVYRNMAYIQANHLQKMPEALANIMKAITLDASEPRYFSEAHLYMSYASLTPQQLSEFLAQYGEMGKDIVDIQLMEIKLNIFNGENDKAIELLTQMTYHIKEGATFNPHVYWFDAHLQKGLEQMNHGEHAA
ncbi:MAG: tetratricopeptide repeat protein, partial [Candidatus Hydrogenedentes bacterium]|nr:tetratricopeptide repeat protein [Candidatus Hydrogenedentota bacterium]